MNIKIIPRIQEKKAVSPTWKDLFSALLLLFNRLPARHKTHALAAAFLSCMVLGLLSMVTIDKLVNAPAKLTAKEKQALPHNLIVEIPSDTPVFIGEQTEFVPLDDGDQEEPEPDNPAPRTNVAPKNAEAYIKIYAKTAKQSQKKYRVPTSITLAQGLIEGNAGKSSLAIEANNHFGIKCFDRNCKKGHCVNRTDDTHKDFFRKYPNVQACFDDHGKKISSGRYAKLKKYGNNYRRWAYGLKACGYATDRTYAEKLIGVIERYELYKYD